MAKSKSKSKYNYFRKSITLPDGTRKYFYGKTKAELDAKVAEAREQIAAGVKLNDNTTFGELAKIWMDTYKAPYVRPSSLRTLRYTLNARVMPAFAHLRVRDITPLQIQTLIGQLANERYTATSTVLTYLRQIFAVGVELGCIARSPVPVALKVPRRPVGPSKQVIPYTVDNLLRSSLRPCSEERLVYLIGVDTGCRRSEIYALGWKCIDLDNRIIHVARSLEWDEHGFPVLRDFLKTDAGLRDVPISDDLYDELRVLSNWSRPSEFLFADETGKFPKLRRTVTIWEHIRAAAAKADPEFATHFTGHVMRHTYITRLFEAGLDIKEIQSLAGHSDVSTTLGIYTHFDAASRQQDTFARAREALRRNPSNVISINTAR